MDTNKKKKIVGVAVISGVILVSITTSGIRITRNMRKRDEQDTVGTQTQISAQATDFNANTGYTRIRMVDIQHGNKEINDGEEITTNLNEGARIAIQGYVDGSTSTLVTSNISDFKITVTQGDVEFTQASVGGYCTFKPKRFGKHIIKIEHPNSYAVSSKTFTIDTYIPITLNANGGNASTSYIYGALSTMWKDSALQTEMTKYDNPIQVPVKSGEKFLGYWTHTSGGYKVINENGYLVGDDEGHIYTTGTALKEAGYTTLYAHWEKSNTTTYTVTYDANGGLGLMAPSSVTNGLLELPPNIFTRNGYKFLGWSTAPYATTPTWVDQQHISISGNTTLYAVWQSIETGLTINQKNIMLDVNENHNLSYTVNPVTEVVTWSSQNGRVSISSSGIIKGLSLGEDTVFGRLSDGTIDTCNVYVGVRANLDPNGGNLALKRTNYIDRKGDSFTGGVPTKEGYTFKGWAVKENQSHIVQPGGNYEFTKDECKIDTSTFSCNINLIAIWEEAKVTNIEKKDNPTIMTYQQGQDLNLVGGTIEVTYDNKEKRTINMTDSGVEVSGYDKNKVGTQTITLKYGGKTTTFNVTVEGIKLTDITIDSPRNIINVKETLTFSLIPIPSNATIGNVTYTSSDTTVATVDANGVITGKSAGKTTITVTTADNKISKTFNLTVVEPTIAVEGITINKASTSIEVGGTDQLIATITPTNASNKNVTWTSSNPEVATVDANGVVTAKKAGVATITVTTTDGSKTATCEVTVVEPTISVEGITINKASTSIEVGGTDQLIATITPTNASNKNVTWTSSNPEVATVDTNGIVTAKEAGVATITVTTIDGSKTATCEVTVVEQEQKDTTPPVITKVEIQKDSTGNYIVYVTAKDNESGIKAIKLVNDNGTEIEITSKTEDERWYFMPNSNGNYKIKAIDNSLNETTQSYEVTQLLEEAKIETGKDEYGNYIVYITPKSNKIVKSVKVNVTDITKNKTEDGRYYFIASQNGEYDIEIEYEDEKEELTYEETRIKNDDNKDDDNKDDDNKNNDNKNNNNKGTNNGTQKGGTTGQTTDTTTALKTIPKTGTGINAIFAVIAGAAAAAIEWFKQKRKK